MDPKLREMILCGAQTIEDLVTAGGEFWSSNEPDCTIPEDVQEQYMRDLDLVREMREKAAWNGERFDP